VLVSVRHLHPHLYFYMPLLANKIISPGTSLGMWEITENSDSLKWELQWGKDDIKAYQSLNDPKRSMQWLSSRVLLRKMMNTSEFINLQIDEFGKPYLKDSKLKLSISHSENLVGVLISEHECGLDIEHMKPERIEKLCTKYMTENELDNCNMKEFRMEKLYLYWSAKEALYKLYGKRKIDFKQNLKIYPFEWHPGGVIRARIEKSNYLNELVVSYDVINDYIVAYAVDMDK